MEELRNNTEIINNDIKNAKESKRAYETNHDKQVNTEVKVHLAEAWGLKKENEKIRSELRKLRGARKKPISKKPKTKN